MNLKTTSHLGVSGNEYVFLQQNTDENDMLSYSISVIIFLTTILHDQTDRISVIGEAD